MNAAGAILIVFALAELSGCVFVRKGDPTVAGSTVRTETAKRGDLQVLNGLLKDVIYIERPPLCGCAPNTEWTLFVLDPGERTATRVKAHFGRSAGNFVEVQRGIKAGDRVIASDTVPYEAYPRLTLR
jgi:hypothetical protein